MVTLIDDFTTGPRVIALNDETPLDRDIQRGEMLRGSRRAAVTLDVRRNHAQPLFFGIGQTDVSDGEPPGLNLTVPVEAPATLGIFYGEGGGILVDWSKARSLEIDVASYTSIHPVTYTVLLLSDDGGRSKWSGSFTAPPEARVLTLSFNDLRPDTTAVNLQRVRNIDFALSLNGGIRLRSFKVV